MTIDTPSSFSSAITQSTASQIEFSDAMRLVSQRAVSQPGADSVCRRVPSPSVDEVREELATVAELLDIIAGGDAFSPENVSDVLPLLEQLKVPGSVLEGSQLSELGQVIAAIVNMAQQLQRLSTDHPRIAALAVGPPPRSLGNRLKAAIAPDGSVQDAASSDLAQARRRLRSTRRRLVDKLQDLMGELSSNVAGGEVTQRSSRYVIPVRREARSKIKGIVHSESGSGATLFVEPQEAIHLGNELSACEALESRAVIRVLRELTDLVRSHGDEIEDGWRMCVRVDDLFARARYALDVGAVVPTVVPAPAPLVIRQGRHPLLLAEMDAVVPFDLHTEDGETVVVVSGPNTGGKTVLLKAVGLIHALAQAGVVPPVGEGTRLPVFERIYADIGDHQSIAASLSTFSGHLEVLKGVLDSADDRSLVLLDEFGTGTDPSEGAALAGAMLKTLCERGCITIATTHLNQVKRLASETPGAVNASLQFDSERLEPTYRIVKGIPGRSYGLAIARRLGFPPDVMALAEELQPNAERSFEALLGDLEEREKVLLQREHGVDATEQRLQEAELDIAQQREAFTRREAELDEESRRLQTTGRAEARRFLLEARKRVESALALARAAISEATAKEARKLVEDGVREEGSALARLKSAARNKGWKIRGASATSREEDEVASTRASKAPMVPAVPELVGSGETDVRGMLADEAEAAVLRALDGAIVADLASLRIIHGKGSGALRQRVSDILRQDRRVVSFSSPPPHQGGSGVTIAEFRS